MTIETPNPAPPVDFETLAEQVHAVNLMLRADAGGIEVTKVTGQGVVHIRFNGMCGSCMSKPLTLSSTVKPMLMQTPGVTDVEVDGMRISQEAQNGIRRAAQRAAETAAAAAAQASAG